MSSCSNLWYSHQKYYILLNVSIRYSL